MDAILFYLEQESRKLSATCYTNEYRISKAKTMREVRNLAEVHVKPELRHHPAARGMMRTLHERSSARMTSLLDQHLSTLGNCGSVDEFNQVHHRLLKTEWCHLQGNYSQVYMLAERRSREYLQLLTSRIAAASIETAPEEIAPPVSHPKALI